MKTVILFLVLSLAMIVPAQAAWVVHDDCEEVRQELSDCGQKIVEMGQQAEQAEEAKKDAIAVAAVGGTAVAGGAVKTGALVLGKTLSTLGPIGILTLGIIIYAESKK